MILILKSTFTLIRKLFKSKQDIVIEFMAKNQQLAAYGKSIKLDLKIPTDSSESCTQTSFFKYNKALPPLSSSLIVRDAADSSALSVRPPCFPYRHNLEFKQTDLRSIYSSFL